jgi:cystathionine beta-lyase/cystathionine gamma-synthase
MEGASHALLASSGMAAISLIFFTYLKPGDELLIFHDTYGANYKLSLILERFGVTVTWMDAADQAKVPEKITDKTRIIFCETPSNPLCKVIDLAFLRAQADRAGAMLVVDNTFATPFHQNPLALGADLVVHSATKALGGHSDLLAGAVACRDEKQYETLWYTRQAVGSTLDPFPANLLARGLKTLDIRAARMSENAQAMAEFLAAHPGISRVSYPGLPGDPGHETACRQMHGGFGGVLAFDVGQTQEEAKGFVERLKVLFHTVSLGATESLVCIPVLTTMLYLPEERRTSFGVKPNTVRISAGIEEKQLLVDDLEQALIP